MIEESPNQSQLGALIEWLVRELAQILDISQEAVVTNEPFSHFGLDSAKAVGLLNRLGEYLGRKIPVTLVWRYPTIEALANYLCGKPEPTSGNSNPHLFPVAGWNQPIAVIGMACRFPGAPDPAAFWDLLRSGRSAFREISSDRWDINAWYDPDLGKPAKINARMAGLLERIDEFDPHFFGISPREAIQMDPQQRLALELTWEALEDAGVRPDALRDSRTGLFVGVVWHDYETIARKAGAEITVHSGTGQASSIVANRISYALGLQGPSIALDTACSSSLVSVHLACRSLQAGDATLALAGGVNMIIDPDTMVALSKFGGLSPTSQLCAFDSRANGFVRGEGGGFVVLKSLNRALADGDPIYAVIRGTAVNNDGASNGLSAPNPVAQEKVIREACARAGVQTADLHYVEAHGTGTPLGDPIEAHALGSVFGSNRARGQPLLVGSVKTNIGHLEGASGIASLIKLILSVYHRQIPASLNFETPNPHIDFVASNLRVVTKLEPWPVSRKPAVGGASAFGWGGTNCHVIVEEADRSTAHLLPLSASDPSILKATVEKLRTYLDSTSPEPSLRDVCATAATRCSAQLERVAVTGRSVSELSAQLEGFLLGQKRPGVAVGHMKPTRPKLAFVFSPQGSQWLGMGKNLMAVEPVFRTKLAECDRALTKIAGWSLFDELLAAPRDSRLNRAEFVQPALSAMQIGLAELWSSWGIRPDFVAAHSLGEWAAACAAGALSVEETMRVVVESSRAQAKAGAGGGMAVVELGEAEVKERIQIWCGEVFVAGRNSPTSTILSGDADRLKYIVTNWKERGVMCSLIDVDVAAHSPRMDPGLEDLKSSLTGLRPTRTAIPFVSSVSGGYLQGPEMGPEHWARHLRQPVLFTQVIERLVRDGCTIFLEISPHPLLCGGIQQTLGASDVDGLALSSCRRGDDERGSLLNSLGALYAFGCPVAWPAVMGGGHDDLSLPIPAALRPATSPIASVAAAPLLLPLSGHTAEALRDRARSTAHYIRTKHDVPASDVAYIAAARRTHLEHRLAVVGTRRDELISALEAFAEGQYPVNLVAGHVRSTDTPKVAFVCSGQGSQWWGMGRELLASVPIFRREIARCADEMKRHVAWDLLEEFTRDEASSRLGETEIAQPALFALQVALATVWRSWGIEPHALVGHSVGEVATAYLGGVLSFDDAVRVICHRGRLMQRATGLGKMAAIELPEADIESLLVPYRDRVSTAAINSPTSTVISGEAAAVEEIVSVAKSRGIPSKVLPVNYAFHSPQMEPFGPEMAEAVSGLTTQCGSVPVYSTVTGAQTTKADFNAHYWGRNIRQTVRFAAAVQAMLDAGINTFVELSPHSVLSSMVLQCAATLQRNVEVLPSLRQGQPEQFEMLKALTSLFATGAEIDWQGVYPEGGRVVPLPLYPWQRNRFWLDLGVSLEPDAQSIRAEVPADWFYDVRWEEKPRTEDRSVRAELPEKADDSEPELTATPDRAGARPYHPSAAGRWLVFSDIGGFAQRVAQQLEQDGGECILVQAGDRFDASNPRRPIINVDKPEDYRYLFKDGTLWRGVLHAWTLDAVFDEANALPDLEQAEHLGCGSALFLVQALAEMGSSQPPRLWLLTRGAQTAWPQVRMNSIAQAPVWGLGRTLALEHPEFWGGLIDIAVDGDPQVLAGRVALEMCFPDREDQIALSGNVRLVPRLYSTQPPLPMPMAIKSNASYLITGGMGGLGPHIAGWLVENGARHLFLCGRRELPERSTWGKLARSHQSYEQVVAIQKLEKQGATVHVEQIDVADRGQMEALIKRVRCSSAPLRGIIHAAADIKFCPLREMSADALHATMRAKVEGAWLLHELSDGLPLDFFVLFSSIAALFGASRIGHYAASNQFLDFLAHCRRAAGLPALSINWGAWEEIRSLREKRDEGELFGLKRMRTNLALQALSFLTTEGAAQRMVAGVDWELLKPAVETRGRHNFFEHISAKPAADQSAHAASSGWIERLDRISWEDRRELVLSLVAGETRRVLGLNAEDQLDPDRGLFALGMNSLMSVQLKGCLEKSIGSALPATLTFTYPTVHALTDFLLSQLLKLATPGAVDVASRNESNGTQSPDENLTDLSDDEIKKMLSAELNSLHSDLHD